MTADCCGSPQWDWPLWGKKNSGWSNFWHNHAKKVKDVVRSCKQCQLVKHMSSIKCKPEQLRNIPIWDQFYKVALYTVRPLLEACNNNIYIWMAIDHYSKWCKAKVVVDHDV
jgi:hypothetical protein